MLMRKEIKQQQGAMNLDVDECTIKSDTMIPMLKIISRSAQSDMKHLE